MLTNVSIREVVHSQRVSDKDHIIFRIIEMTLDKRNNSFILTWPYTQLNPSPLIDQALNASPISYNLIKQF